MTNPDRVAFSIGGRDIYWYGVLMAVGIVLALFFAMQEGKRKKLYNDAIIDMALWVIPCGVIGARLYYVLWELDSYLANPITILYIWEGGLALYGAVIGGLIGAYIFSRRKKIRFSQIADCIALGLPLAQAIGRWGNYFNQEAFGLPVTAEMLAKHSFLAYFPFSVRIDAPWRYGYHTFDSVACNCEYGYHLATFFYESIWCFLIFVVLSFNRKKFKHDGDAILTYGLLYAFERMFVEGLRGDSLYLIRPDTWALLPDGIRASQVLSLVLFLAIGIFFIVRAQKERKLGKLIWPASAAAAAPEAAFADAGAEEESPRTEKAKKDGDAEAAGEEKEE